jgi:cytochrome c oxidase assembly factor CtaG
VDSVATWEPLVIATAAAMMPMPMRASTMASPWQMAGMGLMTSLLAPAIVLGTRTRYRWSALSWPAPAPLVAFVILHGAVTLGMDSLPAGAAISLLVHCVLLLGAFAFWLPVLGGPHRLDPGGRAVYLFLGAPSLDLAGVFLVARGDSIGGLAMIVAMFPIGLAAVWLAWRWIRDEELAARRTESGGDRQFGPLPGWVSHRQ